MRLKIALLLILALGCSLGAWVAFQPTNNEEGVAQAPTTEQPDVGIFVAYKHIDAGEPILADAIILISKPVSEIPYDAFTDFDELENRVPYVRIRKGEPIRRSQLYDFAYYDRAVERIRDGYQALTLPVSTEWNWGLSIHPNRYVDVVVRAPESEPAGNDPDAWSDLIRRLQGEDDAASEETELEEEIILEHVRVFDDESVMTTQKKW